MIRGLGWLHTQFPKLYSNSAIHRPFLDWFQDYGLHGPWDLKDAIDELALVHFDFDLHQFKHAPGDMFR